MCMQWKDKCGFCMFLSPLPDKNVRVVWRGKKVIVLKVINAYTNMMGGVDWSDEMMIS